MSTPRLHHDNDVCFNDSPVARSARTEAADPPRTLTPWAWCPYKDRPHDAHMVNEGNTRCGGTEGMLPPLPAIRVRERIAYWTRLRDDELARIQSATHHVEQYNAEIARYEKES